MKSEPTDQELLAGLRCPLCGRGMRIRTYLGANWMVDCGYKDSNGVADHVVGGPIRTTKRGAVNAYRRMTEKGEDGEL